MPYPDSLLNHYRALQNPNETLHRTVRQVVASYNSAWDPLTELIQNAVDAVNQRRSQEPGHQGRIRIRVDAGERTVLVEDNGIGIDAGRRQTMVLPGGSLKTQGNTYGHKGLGFTYCAHISESIRVDTESSSGTCEGLDLPWWIQLVKRSRFFNGLDEGPERFVVERERRRGVEQPVGFEGVDQRQVVEGVVWIWHILLQIHEEQLLEHEDRP